MYKLVLLSLLVAVNANRELEGSGRFLAATRTSTVVVLSTTTIPTVVRRTCWTSAGASLTLCRRRRGTEEQPDVIEAPSDKLIKPSQTVPLQTTALPSLGELKAFELPDNANNVLEPSTEVEVSGMGNCLGRSAFGITIFFTTSTTVVLTSFSTSTSGATTYTLSNCFPSVLRNEQC